MTRLDRNRKNIKNRRNPDTELYNSVYGYKDRNGSIINDILTIFFENSEGSPNPEEDPANILLKIFETLECLEENEHILKRLNKNTIIDLLKRIFRKFYSKPISNFIFLKKIKGQKVSNKKSGGIFNFIIECMTQFMNIPRGWEHIFLRKECRTMIAEKSRVLENQLYYPYTEDVFNCFRLTKFNKIKIVIVGQDPYPGTIRIKGKERPKAIGVSFGIKRCNVSIPMALGRIYDRLENTITRKIEIDGKDEIERWVRPSHGDLTSLAKQGILFINTCLTIDPEEGSTSHFSLWGDFIASNIIRSISEENPNVIFMLWGKKAQSLKKDIGSDSPVLECPHPASTGHHFNIFKQMNHFNEANSILIEYGKTPIDYFKMYD